MNLAEDENGRKQNEICPAKYRFADELLNLAVGSFLLIKGLMFGRNEQVKLPQVSIFLRLLRLYFRRILVMIIDASSRYDWRNTPKRWLDYGFLVN
jgi:hypothetical protein